jgi:hypothetical protein
VTLRARWVDAESLLGDAESSLGDAKSSLGDTHICGRVRAIGPSASPGAAKQPPIGSVRVQRPGDGEEETPPRNTSQQQNSRAPEAHQLDFYI